MSKRRKRLAGEDHSPRELDHLKSSVNYLYHQTDYTPARIAKELGITLDETLALVLKREVWTTWQAKRDAAKARPPG